MIIVFIRFKLDNSLLIEYEIQKTDEAIVVVFKSKGRFKLPS